jgi:hypothetical protein
MSRKRLTTFVGMFEGMKKPELLCVPGKPTKKASIVTITTEDEQTAYFEIRDAMIAKIEKLGIQPGDEVSVGFVFIGSSKNGRTYNNLFINDIDYVSGR